MLYGDQIIGAASRFLSTIMQLAERDAGDAELLGQCVELPQQVRGIILHHMDADVGIEHVGEHQSGSRSSACGCSRPAMKSSLARGPF
jgi:hypothetical protein